MAKLTTLELIADRNGCATRAVNRYRDEAKTWQEKNNTDMKSYREGEAAAYNDAHNLMKGELERLRHLFQNGSLTRADFGLPS